MFRGCFDVPRLFRGCFDVSGLFRPMFEVLTFMRVANHFLKGGKKIKEKWKIDFLLFVFSSSSAQSGQGS